MTKKIALLALLSIAVLSTTPALGVSKEIIQLQTQVQLLQDQMSKMQQSFDERMGVMRNLIEQSTDNINKATSAVGDLQKTLQQQSTDNAAKLDQLSAQIQALHDSLDEMKTRVAKVSKQLDDMTGAGQNLPPGAATPTPGQAPPPDVLYNNALRDYNAAKYQLAVQEFADYLKFYGNTDLAGNAQFYIGEIDYRQQNFEQAIKDYDLVLQQYPGGNKAAAAQLKKGYALLELGQKKEGTQELNSLIARYPRSVEATQARDRLRQLGVTGRKPPAGKR
jgi:tol-pal system protein YbgF